MTVSSGGQKVAQRPEEDHSKLVADRLRKLQALKDEGINPYPYRFERSHKASQLQELYKDLANEVETEDAVSYTHLHRPLYLPTCT